MNARRVLVPVVCALVGFALGAYVYPGPYVYGNHNGAAYRVNRLTGVEEYASSKGWVSAKEMMRESVDATFGGLGEAFRGMAGRHP